jgi:preprotein translocase subunit YajC
MQFIISDAYAQTAQQPQQPDMLTGLFLPMIFLAVVFYFLIIRPQSKRAKEHKSMLADLGKGDEIATNGGLIGKVVKIGENFVEIEVSDGVNVRVQKHAIANLMPKGTMKASD